MKTLFLLIALLPPSLSANAATFYQFNRWTTNADPQAQLSISNFNNGTGASSSTFWRGDKTWASAGGSYAGPTLTPTNLISGRPYTNSTGRPQMVIQGVVLNTAIANGAAEMSFYVDVNGGVSWGVTNRVTDGTTALTQSDQNIRQITGFVPVGASYVITNTSRAAGNSAQIDVNQTTGLLITY
jgi:hypothetical protein